MPDSIEPTLTQELVAFFEDNRDLLLAILKYTGIAAILGMAWILIKAIGRDIGLNQKPL